MKTNGVLIVLIILLVIWNGFLSLEHLDTENSDTRTEEVSTYEVSGFSTDLTEVAEKVQSSSVSVVCHATISSGFIYRSEENAFYVVMSNHGLTDEGSITVILDNDIRYNGELVGKDIYSDIAVIRVECDLEVPVVQCGDSELLKSGEFVLISGTPGSLELKNSVTMAMVSSASRTITNTIVSDGVTSSYYLNVVQLSGDVDSGYSGAPVFNMNGECVGVISMKSTSQVLGVPINEVKLVADQLISNGSINKVMFGIKGSFVKDLETYEKSALNINLETTSGLYVSQIQNGSVLMGYGIKQGDIIRSINDVIIEDNTDYLNICYSGSKEYTFVLERGTETLELKVTFDD